MTKDKPAIIGAKGGGTASVTQNVFVNPSITPPTIARDNLQSKAFARILDLISEGEIGGLVNGEKSIYLDDTPLQATTGVNNFLGVTVQTKTGTQDQSYIEGFEDAEVEKVVATTIEAENFLSGTWARPQEGGLYYVLWDDVSYTRSGSTITFTWTAAHGLTTGDRLWINFEKNDVYDNIYSITVLSSTTFSITSTSKPDLSLLRPDNGNAKALKPYLRINANTRNAADWVTDTTVFIRFLLPSSDPNRKTSSIYPFRSTYDKTYSVIAAQDIEGASNESATHFYIAWQDRKATFAAAQTDGGQIAIADSTYQYNKSLALVSVTAPNHGLTTGMSVSLVFRNGPLKGTRTYTITGSTTNQFFFVETGFTSTGSGVYLVEVPFTSGAVTRQVTNNEVDRIRINISVPALQRQSTATGDVGGSKFIYAVDFQFNGGGYFEAKNETIKGKTSGGYSFSRELNFRDYAAWNSATISDNFPIDVRVRRVNEDSSSATIVNAFTWQSYTEIIDSKLRYPNSALVALELDAQQFNSIPSRTYYIKGIKIKLPSNATVNQSDGSITYSGIWDGTFGAATWCADPAWILYDFLTSRRYGFGEQILTKQEKQDGDAGTWDGNASRLDKWSFYAASQYCNELVQYTIGSVSGVEPRFLCNVNIQSRQEAFNLVNQMLSVFRAQAFWNNGTITLAQDRPQDPAYLFGASNVINGDFSYSGSDIKTRPTVALVRYFDEETRDIATEIVEDNDLIAKYGYKTEELDAFACSSQSQAARLGKWLLYSNAYETETISFSVGIDSGVVVRPGMIISVNDPTRAGTRMSGRISAGSTTTNVVIDVNRTINANDELSLVLPDGIVETRTVSSYNSGTRTITVSSAFSVIPEQNGIWLLTSSALEPTTWRVLSLAEDAENGVYSITALAYNSGKYAYVESGAKLQPKTISVLGEAPPAPANLTWSESLYADNNKVFVRVAIGWSPSERAVAYQFRYRVGDNNWEQLPDTSTSQIDINNAEAGQWQVEVVAISVVGKKSEPAAISFEVVGKTAIPEDMQKLEISQVDTKLAELSWPVAVDLDVLIGGKVIIRHTPETAGVTWRDSLDIVASVAGNQTKAYVPLLAGTYLARFEDSSGNRSANAVSVIVTLPDPATVLVVDNWTETIYGEAWTAGEFSGTHYNTELDGLVLNSALTIDELAADGDFDGLGLIDALGGTLDSGIYLDFQSLNNSHPLTAPGVFDYDIRRNINAQAFLPGDLWDERTDLMDTWDDIDGSNLDAVNAEVYVRTSNDNPYSSEPVFTEWEPLINGTRQMQFAQFKLVLTSSDPLQNIVVKDYGATITVSSRTEQDRFVLSGAGSKTIAFANAFWETPSIGITAHSMATGDYYELTSLFPWTFTVTFKNAAGNPVSRRFDWQAVGHGKRLA